VHLFHVRCALGKKEKRTVLTRLLSTVFLPYINGSFFVLCHLKFIIQRKKNSVFAFNPKQGEGKPETFTGQWGAGIILTLVVL